MVEVKMGVGSIVDVVKQIKKEEDKIKTAVDKTVKATKTDVPPKITKAVRAVYTISAGDMKKEGDAAAKFAKTVQGPKINGIVVNGVRLTYRGRVLTPIHFNMTPKKLPDKKRKYTVRAAFKQGPKKELVGKYNTPVFLARASKTSNVYLPYQRVEKKGLPIYQIKSVSIPQMVDNEIVAEDIQKNIAEVLEKRTKSYFRSIFNGTKRKSKE